MIYLLQFEVQYEGRDTLGIYDSLDKAVARVDADRDGGIYEEGSFLIFGFEINSQEPSVCYREFEEPNGSLIFGKIIHPEMNETLPGAPDKCATCGNTFIYRAEKLNGVNEWICQMYHRHKA